MAIWRKSCFMGLFLIFNSLGVQASPPSIVEAKLTLQRLDSKINHLKQQLASAQDQQSVLENSLARMDKQMTETERQLTITTELTKEKSNRIQVLNEQSHLLAERLASQQNILATYIRARYRMGRDNVLRSLLSSDALDQTHRQLLFFHYLLRAHQQLIMVMRETNTQWVHTKKELKEEYKNYSALQKKLGVQQKQLQQNKQIQLNIMENLATSIHMDQRTLQDYEHDKARLAVLLARLTIKSHQQVVPRRYASTGATLMTPLAQEVAMKRWNQGLLFVVPAGASVKAVKGGRVVFSDFLRGYGLLLILDHGHGLMTLYGYNQAVFKRRGDWVSAGEQIAIVGRSSRSTEQGLYFEARRDGRVIAWPEVA